MEIELVTNLGERVLVHVLFQQYLATPTLEDALQMRAIRTALELNKLPEGNLRREDLEAGDKTLPVAEVQVRWLREKIRAAFAAQKITSAYSDFALTLLDQCEAALVPQRSA